MSAEIQTETIGPKNRNALLRYMVILFVVAFLIVSLSLLVQMRNSQNTITALNQTSASALQNAEQLQQQNQALTREHDALQETIHELEDSIEELEQEIRLTESELTSVKQEQAQVQEQSQARIDAYELLLRALQARQNEDMGAFNTAMDALAEVQENLSPAGAELYKQLSETTEEETDD